MIIKLRLLTVLLIASFVSFAQEEYKTNITNDFNSYVTALSERNFDEATEYIIPDFFSIVPKDKLIEVMEMLYNNPEIEFSIMDFEILEIDEKEDIEGDYYSILSYGNTIEMKFNLGEEDETAEEKDMRNEMIEVGLKETFGEDNVSLKKETGFFTIYSVKPVCAMSENGLDNWKFVVVEEEQKKLLKMFLPKQIMKKISNL